MQPIIAAASSGSSSGPGGVIALILITVAYWAPSFAAYRRGVRNRGSIVVINFFAFLIIPWIIALAMAFSDPGPRREPPPGPPSA